MPVSMFSYTFDYIGDKTCHKFWRKNATKVCDDEEDIRGKIVIVTGSNCGIGKEVALQLARRHAVVIMAVRDLEKGAQAKVEIEREVPYSVLVVKKLDLENLGSIYSFVEGFERNYHQLNLLVNNAGVMSAEKKQHRTRTGFELNMGVNHLGTFLLTKLLLNSLRKGTPRNSSFKRVVTLASTNLSIAKLDLDDFMMDKRVKSRDGYREQYNISKLAIAMCYRKLVRDLRKNDEVGNWKQVKFYLMCPGLVRTALFRSDAGCWRKFITKVTLCSGGISVHQGSETVCYLCLSRSVAERDDLGNGEMYRFMKIWQQGEKVLKEWDDSEQMERLYLLTEQLLGIGMGMTECGEQCECEITVNETN